MIDCVTFIPLATLRRQDAHKTELDKIEQNEIQKTKIIRQRNDKHKKLDPPYEGDGNKGSEAWRFLLPTAKPRIKAPSGTLGPRERALSSLYFWWRR